VITSESHSTGKGISGDDGFLEIDALKRGGGTANQTQLVGEKFRKKRK